MNLKINISEIDKSQFRDIDGLSHMNSISNSAWLYYKISEVYWNNKVLSLTIQGKVKTGRAHLMKVIDEDTTIIFFTDLDNTIIEKRVVDVTQKYYLHHHIIDFFDYRDDKPIPL